MRIFDAGCGSGRNLVYLLQQGYEVFAIDADPYAIREVRRARLSGRLFLSLTSQSDFLKGPAIGLKLRFLSCQSLPALHNNIGILRI